MASRYERYQYIYGNTVREVEEPVLEPKRKEQPEERRQPKKKRVVKSNPRVREFNAAFTMTLTVAVAALVIICAAYLQGQHQLSEQIQSISSKRTELTTLISENNSKRANLEKSVDYDSIKEYAQETLGMSVPGEESTIYYEGASSDYVRQYEDIPATD
ncbi:MAG: septum formation initiator family protein [Lachnospiraceae bacterium]|nr:septum formation initiator family protein [Lachnospiraceae bacterium]